MGLKFKVFAQMIIGLLLMILILFASLKVSYTYSQSITDQLRDSMYLHQQKQVSRLLLLYSLEFSQVFQRHSENLQAIDNFEQKVLLKKVIFDPKFVQLIGNREKMYKSIESEPLQTIYNENKYLLNTWFNKDTLEVNELDLQVKMQMSNSEYSSLLPRLQFNQKKIYAQDKRQMLVTGMIQAQTHSGTVYSVGPRSSFSAFKPHPACPYKGKYNFDPRCRNWYLQTSKQHRVTPIQPSIIFSNTFSFLAVSICKSGRKYQQDLNGNMVKTNCTFSVNCISFALNSVNNYFQTVNYNLSQTFMIDPRSKIMVYNQLSNQTQNITFLSNATAQLFPNDTSLQSLFIQKVMDGIQKNNNSEYAIERLMIDENNSCEVNPFKVEELLRMTPVKFEQYAYLIPKISLTDQLDKSNSFTLRSGEKEEVFITLDYINIIEKLQDQPYQRQYEIQNLFVAINVLPKHLLTKQSDMLKEEISLYITWVSITSLILCCLLMIMAGIISYRVSLMIEKPLIHMIDLLNKLDQEGCSAAIDYFDSQLTENDTIFLSRDSEILFQSFKRIFEMLQIATKDIFTVESSSSLLRLNYQIQFFKEFNNIRVLGICYNNMGNIHFQNGRYFESMEAYQDAIILAQQEAGFYKEQVENDVDCYLSLEQQYELDKLLNEQKRKVMGIMTSQSEFKKSSIQNSLISSLYSKLKITFSTTQFSFFGTNKRKSKQNSIDKHLKNQQEASKELKDISFYNQRKYKNVSEEIKEIIFDRKLNFSHALYMHNISQNAEAQVIERNFSSKVLNNPINYIQNKQSIHCLSSTKINIEWENYEKILLDLIELNQKLVAPSFGRTIILLTQLSLCHLKMEKIQQAADEQSLAIDHYHFAITLEQMRKNKTNLDQSHLMEQNGINFNMDVSTIPSKIFTSKNYLAEGKVSTQVSPLLNQRREQSLTEDPSRLEETEKCLKESDWIVENEKSQLEIDEEFSLLITFRKRQFTTKSKQMNISNNSYDLSSYRQTLNEQIYVLNNHQKNNNNGGEIEIEIENEEQKEESEKEQNLYLNQSFGQQIKHPPQSDRICCSHKNILLSPYQLPIKKKVSQFARISSNSDPQGTQNNKPNEIYPILKTYESPKNKNQSKEEETSSFEQRSQRSTLQQQIFQKQLATERQRTSSSHKYPLQGNQLTKNHAKSKKRNAYLNSKLNKQFLQEDFDQISRYELPSDILLYYITLQESRLLLFENKEVQSAFILTNLLEKSKFYLPYYRLACLNVLSCITNTNQKIQYEINKLMRRFDSQIQFIASIAVAVNSCNQDAANAIRNLVSEIFTKDEDIISLLLYEQDNFQQILPSITIQQLHLSDEYQYSFLDQIYEQQDDENKSSLLLREESMSNSSPFKWLPPQNQNQLTEENEKNNGGDGEKQADQIVIFNDDQFNSQKIDDSMMYQINRQDPLEQRQIEQFMPLFKTENPFSQISLKTDNNRGEKEGFLIENSPFQKKYRIKVNEISPQINSFKDINNSKQQLFTDEDAIVVGQDDVNKIQNDTIIAIECISAYQQQNRLKKEEQEVQITYADSPNASPCSKQEGSFCAQIPKESNNIIFSSLMTSNSNLNNLLNKQNNESYHYGKNPVNLKKNLIFHIAIRKCIMNCFNSDSTQYQMHKQLIQKGIFSSHKKFVIFIADSFGIIANQAYEMLSNLLYSIQTQLLILILNENEQLQEHNSFKNVEINGKSVIKYFYTQENLLKYIRNKRESMKNFGVPLLVEHLNM